MATVSTIGTGGRNYSTIAAWDAAFANGGWEGQCYNDSEFITSGLSINGTSALNYAKLSAAAGQGMMDNSSNPLRYDIANGAGIRSTTNYSVVMTLGSYTTIERLGLRMDGAGNNCRIIQVSNGVGGYTAVLLNRLLMEYRNDINGYQSCMVHMGRGVSLLNSVLIDRGAQCPAVKLLYSNATSIIANNTIVTDADNGTNVENAFDNLAGATFYCANNAIFGYSACSSTSTALAGSKNATDLGSFAGSTSPITGLSYANQFISNDSFAAALDFKLKPGNSLAGAGIDTASSGVTVDIFGTARPHGGTWDIGAHEQAAAVNYTLTAAQGSFAWTGGAATLRVARKLAAASGVFTWTGAAATLRAARKLVAAAGSFLWAGGDATFDIEGAPPGDYTLTAEAGSFSWTGGGATLRASRRLVAGSGSFSWTGAAATLRAARKLVAVSGAFAWTGGPSILRASRKIVAAAGSFTWIGSAAMLRPARKLVAESGAYVWTGAAATLRASRKLAAGAGSFAWTGGDATLRKGRILAAQAGAFVWAGADATFHIARHLIAEAGAFIWTGGTAEFPVERPFRWEPVPESPESWANQSADSTTWTEQGRGASPWSEM